MRNTNFYEAILILIILIGIISLSFANNMSEAIIHNTGKIIAEISARSGSAKDIQEAVDLAGAVGFGIVRIPEGTFNFVEVGEPWKTVVVPAGISIFGALTGRDSNDQVVEWKTVLVMPYDVPSGAVWFKIVGNSDPNKPSRFSDTKLVGYRDFDPNSTSMHTAFLIDSVINFRVDHCYFKHTCGGIFIYGHYCRGVIDHCYLVNDYGIHEPFDQRTVGYGISITRDYYGTETEWESDITKIFGKYTNYTVFIEDCYFKRWRHCVTGNLGAHYVVRHCEFDSFGFGEVDMHEQYLEPRVPTRASEIYENQFNEPLPEYTLDVIRIRSGASFIFNNTVSSGFYYFIYTYDSGWNPDFYPQDMYIWNNTISGATLIWGSPSPPVQGEDYFLYKPDWYTPYPYPHPLTSS